MSLMFIMYLVLNLFRIFPISEQGTCDTNQTFPGLASIYENQPIDTVIYNYTMFANSTDIVSVVLNFPNLFYFNINTKQLIANISFDRETTSFYSLQLIIYCTTGSKIIEQTIVINDLNDNAAQWQYSPGMNFYNGSIFDNSSSLTAVTFNNQPSFKDLDSNTSYNVLLLDPLNQNSFYVSTSYISTNTPVIISSNGILDYDKRSMYNLTLYLMDKDPGTVYARFNSTATVVIMIIGTGSKPPIFESNYYQFTIYSNSTNNSEFVTSPKKLRAYDGDIRFNATINYKLTVSYSFLSLDHETGVLRIITPYTPQIFVTSITAYQVKNPNVQAIVSVQISITDFNSLVPVKFTQKIVSISTAENVVAPLVQLNFTYSSLSSIQFSMQPVVSNILILSNGLVTVLTRFFYAKQNFYNLTITTTDSRTSDQMTLLITILKINEKQPKFSENYYNFLGSINLPMNTFTTQVIDYDLNTTMAFQLIDTYGLFNTSNSTTYFYISIPTSSVIQRIIYYLKVIVTESGQPPLSNSVNVSIDFTITPSTTTNVPPIDNLLALYILLPIIAVLIIALPVILCYYKKRRVFKATGSSLAPSIFNDPTDSFIKRWGKCSDFNENVFNISDIYNSDRYVGQLQKTHTDPVICASIENHRKRLKEDDNRLDTIEIQEYVFPESVKSPNSKYFPSNPEKVVAL